MSQRPNNFDPKQYKDFPKSYEDFQNMRKATKSEQKPPAKKIPIPVGGSSRSKPQGYAQEMNYEQQHEVPIVSKANQNHREHKYGDVPIVSKANQNYREQQNVDVPVTSQNSTRPPKSSILSDQSPRTNVVNPSRTKPQFNIPQKESVDEPTQRNNQYFSTSPSSNQASMTHGDWVLKKDQEKKYQQQHPDPNLSRNLKEYEFGWKQTDMQDSLPPNDFTISHINQHHDLLVI